MSPTSFLVPPVDTVTYGAGAFDEISSRVAGVGGSRVMVILSGSLAGGPVEEALHARLGPAIAGVYARTRQHVPRSSVLEATEMARDNRADCVLSVGGGTPIDCAKAVALALRADIRRPEDFDHHRVRFTYPSTYEVPPLEGDVVPHVAVPTTLSGGEHTGLCGVTDDATRAKDAYTSPKLQPRAVILDPWVSAGTPGWLWAASGMRAVDHAVEGILSARHMPMTDALGAGALRLLSENLETSSTDPGDEQARTACLLGTWLSIFGLTNVGVGLSHGIGHQLAAEFDMIHGVTSAIMLPSVMEFTRARTLPRLRLVAEAMGVDTRDLSADAAADAAIGAVRDLVTRLGVPDRISAAGGRREALPGIADHVMGDAAVAASPRPVTRADILALLDAAF
ncbi:iron-containing alcohol dehydrogenase [Pseudonocardia sp. ICBG1293]|uniref:iron-containing alcohol dehydrogenase n=1 Tax=Pseudonocardia sp. ICBG1293 TaxID=2844382 RepID=UPI001CCD186E|nr:iron-containing alcohol dehydrogenase [Pseudonocardia sp. ICBG1293]